MTVDAADVLRQQADLRDRFRDPRVLSVIANQWRDINGYEIPPAAIGAAMTSALNQAKSYRIEHQMTDVIQARADSLADDTPMSFPPHSVGFAVFEKPFVLHELRGRTELIHAITWMPMVTGDDNEFSGYIISAWNDIWRQADEVYLETVAPNISDKKYRSLAEHMGRWSMTGMRPLVVEKVGPRQIPVRDEDREKLRKENWVGPVSDFTSNFVRTLAALFDMLSERIPATREEPAILTRSEKKMAHREGIAPEVVLVTLRKEYKVNPENKGTGHPISVQYAMGNPDDPNSVAYYRTIHKGTPRERKVAVRSHWRGPKDAPVSERKHVYNLAR